jgi:pentatricopeptide repeat protein
MSVTSVRKSMLQELLKNGMSRSPLAVQKAQRVLDRLDRNGPRDVHVYNALLRIALFRKELGPRDQFLAEMETNQVTPDGQTLALLLATVAPEEAAKGAVLAELVKLFRTKYSVRLTVEPAVALLRRYAEVGRADEALRVFQGLGSLAERPEAWEDLVTAHCNAGRVKEAVALLESMNDAARLRPHVGLFNRVLAAAATKADGSTEHVLQLMRRLKVDPTTETLDALGAAEQPSKKVVKPEAPAAAAAARVTKASKTAKTVAVLGGKAREKATRKRV